MKKSASPNTFRTKDELHEAVCRLETEKGYGNERSHGFFVNGQAFLTFPPSHYTSGGMIDETIFAALVSGKKALVVGAGAAFLEEILVELGVPASNLILCDLEKVTESHMVDRNVPDYFKFYKMDMLKQWPNFDSLVDFVFFPHVLGTVFDRMEKRNRKPITDMALAAKITDFKQIYGEYGGKDQIHSDISFLTQQGIYLAIESITLKEVLDLQRHVISEALAKLTSSGQIRIGGLSIPYHQMCYVHRELSSQYASLIVTPELTVIQK